LIVWEETRPFSNIFLAHEDLYILLAEMTVEGAITTLVGGAMVRCTHENLSQGDRSFIINRFHFSRGEPMTEITETRTEFVTCCRDGCPDTETEERFASHGAYHTVRSKKVHNRK
jgi:hypothetical protein